MTTENMPEKMDLKSMDISAENREKLKALFPSVFTETQDKNGELVESIDFEKLKAELGTFSDVFEARRERYGMDWPGKKDCMKLIQEPSIATLKPCREESINFDTSENLFIEGDNLEVLKLLQKSYYGKVKMIYIDPPYNTGKEFIYPDKYSESLDTYLAYAGLADDEGRKFATNTPNEGRFHTRWMNMMYPRLYLAKNLLSEDGVVLISVDDNEITNLRKICDEPFGEENFIGMISRATGTRMGTGSRGIARELDYLLVYSKTDVYKLSKLSMTAEESAIYNEEDERGKYLTRSLRRTGGENRREDRPSMYYPVISPDGDEIYPIAPEGWESRWVCGKETYEQLLRDGYIEWKKVTKNGKERWQVYQKHYLSEEGKESSDLWIKEEGNKKATRDLNALFDKTKVFDHPKPVGLIRKILQLGTNKKGKSIVLDFFAGSCCTGHAVIEQNILDGGNRKFIMVQLPEPCDEKSEAYKAGYKTIADIGKERIRRVINKIEEERAAKTREADGKLPGMEEKQPEIDIGFKVLKLDKSNFKIWDGSDPDASEELIAKQLELFVEHIDPVATQEDILFELLLKAGFMPTEKVSKLELAGKFAFSIAEGALLICLEDEITRNLIDAVAEAEPMQFICLDRGFQNNDQLKANAVQTFAARNQGREKAEQIVFRTV